MNMRYTEYVAMIMLLVVFAACTSVDNNSHVTKDEPKKTASAQLDSLEKIFGNDNWLVVIGKDSGYFYFSRLSANNFKTYSYKMLRGDSTASVVTDIKTSGDSVFWQLPGKDEKLMLTEVDGGEAIWSGKDNSNSYTFKRIDDNKLVLKCPDGNSIYFLKTITLSAFLVKSKYDYKNGSRLAFENIK